MTEERSVLIIGGGIAGLSAGCYARMNGFRTRILEMHKKPGGLCTSWKRQGYTVNGCVHWLVGSGPAAGFHQVWQELGAVQGRTFVDPVAFGVYEDAAGARFTAYADLDRLEAEMLRLSPADARHIRDFIAAARRCARVDMPWDTAPELLGFFGMLRLILRAFPLLRVFWTWNRVSLREFGARFRHPLLRDAFPLMFLPEFPVSFMVMTFAWLHNRTAGYPIGGSLELSRAIERRYLDLGGEITYRARVKRILVENGRATGAALEDGTEIRADHVVSAADGHATIHELLDGRYLDDTIRGYYERLVPFPPLVHVALGVRRTFTDLPVTASGFSIELPEPVVVGGVEHRHLGFRVYNQDPGLAPAGGTVITAMFATDFDHWQRLRADDAAYRAEKELVADRVVALLDRRFPGLASQVEMRDVASPTTFVRYTGNWKGSFEGWQVTPSTWRFGQVMRKTLPGLENFYMAGHWVEPGGGLPTVALSGRNVVQLICRKEGRRFTTARP